ncbi:hypothetical protein UT300019_23520 [Clostridium sp. CTA-19]
MKNIKYIINNIGLFNCLLSIINLKLVLNRYCRWKNAKNFSFDKSIEKQAPI